MKQSFLNQEKPILTTMVQAETPERIKELIDLSLPEGAEAFGMQFCRFKENYRTKEIFRDLFSYAQRPVYVTNYRHCYNEGKSDDQLAEELVLLASYGATLCDVMGDYFDPQPNELSENEHAVQQQMKLIDRIHKAGAEVLMSSHVLKFTPAEEVIRIALEHQRRGADICKIVTDANTMAEQIENLRIVTLLKETLSIPFLYLSGGECHFLRRVGGNLGCSMILCVHEYDQFSTNTQPLLTDAKIIRDYLLPS